MEDFSTLIYILFIILSILGGLLGKNRKTPAVPKSSQKPRTHESVRTEKPAKDKSFQEMVDEMLKKHLPQPQGEFAEEAFSEESVYEFGNYETDTESLEEIIQDGDDHRNKNIHWQVKDEGISRDVGFSIDNWQYAILVSEVLGKPKALH